MGEGGQTEILKKIRGFKSDVEWDRGKSKKKEQINGEWQSTEHGR